MKPSILSARLVPAIALAALLLVPLAASAQNLAIVNGKPVPKARADALMTQVTEQAKEHGQALPPDVERRVKDEVVLREIYAQEAEKRGFTTKPEFKEQMETARQMILISELFKDVEATHPISDADVQAEYDKLKAKAGEHKEYHARHILVPKEDEARALIKQLKSGAKFEDLAKKSSKDSGSAASGGDLDWSQPGNYVPEFSQALVKLKKGEFTTEPVKTQFGWHIIKLEDVRDAQLPALADVKPQIQQRLGQQRLAAFRDELKAKAKTDYKFN